ncbi:hypothetical protein BC629DRAFT_1443203 [Irpex lacteus]|nr:hypothetical protein BC629DRAFT_1443203 [Irpex lacteus]
MRNAMVPMVDADGNRIIPRGPMGGFRMMRGKGVDLSQPLSYVRPAKKKINPTTGEPWTGEELYYDLATFDIQETVVKCRLNYHRLRELDQSLEAVTIPQIVTLVVPGSPPWRFPATVAEVTHLRDVAMKPCNLLALAFWEQFVWECNVVDGEKRTKAQWHGVGLGFHRPFTPGTRVNDTGHPDGQHGGRDRRRGQRHYDPSTDYLNLTRGVTVPRGVGGILEGEPWGGISVPWVERDTNRCIVNLSPLRGMLKVATLGCDGPDGRLTLLFVGRVAQFVREHNLVILPSQLMRGVADWLLAVDLPGDAASMGDSDEDGWGTRENTRDGQRTDRLNLIGITPWFSLEGESVRDFIIISNYDGNSRARDVDFRIGLGQAYLWKSMTNPHSMCPFSRDQLATFLLRVLQRYWDCRAVERRATVRNSNAPSPVTNGKRLAACNIWCKYRQWLSFNSKLQTLHYVHHPMFWGRDESMLARESFECFHAVGRGIIIKIYLM